MAQQRERFLLPTLVYFTLLVGLPLSLSEWSSSERSSPPALLDDAELVRDAPLYPPLQHETEPSYNDPESTLEQLAQVTDSLETDTVETDDETDVQRDKRSSGQDWDKASKVDNPSVLEGLRLRVPIRYPRGTDAERGPRRIHRLLAAPAHLHSVRAYNAPTARAVALLNNILAQHPELDLFTDRTGDTILNIRGAVRDAIGDAGAAPGPRASSRLDTFVIRPAQAARSRPPHAAPHSQPPLNQVPKHDHELLVEPHSMARIPCDLANVTDLRWYKDNEQLNLPSSPSGSASWREGTVAVVGRATRADAGAWRCAGVAPGGGVRTGEPTHLLIHEPVRSVYLAVDGRRLDAGNTWVPVRDKTELEVRCVAEGGVPPPELTWRLLALEPTLDHRPYLRIHQTNYSIEGVSSSHAVVTAARELHNATLACAARQRHRPAPHSAKLEIHVTYPPSFVISRWPGFGVSLSAGGAAALRCDVDANPPARAWWLRDDDNPTSSPPPPDVGAEAPGSATLRWAALRGAHAGWYRCRASWLDAEYSSIGYYLNVLAPEEPTEAATEPSEPPEPEEEPEHQKVDVPVGGNVQLHCPKGSVGCWWRRVVGNSSSEWWAPAGSAHAHGALAIRDALYQEAGEYRCVGARPPAQATIRELKRVTVRVGGAATAAALSARPAGPGGGGGWRLECGACGRHLRVLWVRGPGGPGGLEGPGGAEIAALTPDLHQHCWRAVLHVHHADEVWCVAAAPGGGAVAVFPPRVPHPSPAPARHSVRPPHGGAGRSAHAAAVLLLCAAGFIL